MDANAEKMQFIKLLLDGPVYSERQIAQIEEVRKSISAWRKKRGNGRNPKVQGNGVKR